MRLLQAMAGAEHGGAEAFFVRLAVALERAGVEQRLVLRGYPERLATLRAAGIEPVTARFGGFFDFATRRCLRAEISSFRPDIVLTWMNRASAFCPTPAQVGHDFVQAARLGGYYKLKYYRRSRHLIANTRGIATYLADQGWPAERVHYLPNFVSAERALAEPRARHDTPDGVPLLLGLGRLHTNKAFDTLLGALAQIPEAYLWLAGEGPERDRLESLVRELGLAARVRFLGWRDDTAELFAAADVFVCPSRHEPLGNVVIEAWAQGLPVVAAAAAGPAALIGEGESGLLVPFDEPQALAAALQRLLGDGDLVARLGEGGRVAYRAEFSEEVVVAQYLDFFARVRQD